MNWFIMVDPKRIQQESFRIIEDELGPHRFSSEEYVVVRRVIHATADFDFARQLQFHPRAIQAGLDAIRSGRPIVADTEMVRVGINKSLLSQFGGCVTTFISDPDVVEQAASLGTTRAVIAIRKASKETSHAIIVIGNAPTALLEVIELVREDHIRPALIIGVPVGFVATVESKESLAKLHPVPWITSLGRKGGSPAAVAIVNALLEIAQESGR